MENASVVERTGAAPAIVQHPPARLPSLSGEAGYAHPAQRKAERRDGPVPTALPPYQGETYYDLPAVKPSPFGWKVALYLFLGGLGGGAQIIAALNDLMAPGRGRAITRRGRHIALGVSVVGPVLLVIDLHTPQRFLNMLRIFRKTSGMSIGTYVLMSFAGFSSLTALGQFLGDRAGRGDNHPGYILARVTQVPAAVAGAGMTTYTAALLSSTSTPLWAAAPCLLAMRFASSSMATAAAALSLAARREDEAEAAGPLDTLALAAAGTELAASLAADRQYDRKGVAGALHEPPWGPVHAAGVQALGLAAPIALYAMSRGKPKSRLPVVAALAILAGGFLMRAAILHAGNRSAKRPRDYFTLAQPGTIPENRDAVSLAQEVR